MSNLKAIRVDISLPSGFTESYHYDIYFDDGSREQIVLRVPDHFPDERINIAVGEAMDKKRQRSYREPQIYMAIHPNNGGPVKWAKQ